MKERKMGCKTDSDKITSKNYPIRKVTGTPTIDDFAGIWQSNPKTLEQVREKAWKRDL